ncbi:MAG: hypothetical protein U0263_30260 [Polyangiaceae bacterium]
MSQERLTRQELSWLLAQEARGAARALREGVAQLTQPPIAGPKIEIQAAPAVETNLDALDEAIARLGELQMGPKGAAPRRGRIDLAALVCEVMPNARIAMDTGSGTEVFGEEQELRRMIHLLVSQTNSTPADSGSARPDVEIRRDGEWLKISVELGPDSSATAELERRWLSRMATRHGGRLELEGGTETLFLPADRATEEMAELRRELEQAQQLGEAYARELAAVFAEATKQPSDPAAAPPPAAPGGERLELVISMSSALVRLTRAWLEGARADIAEAQQQLGGESEIGERLTRRISGAQELFAELERVAQSPLAEAAREVDLVAVLGEIVAQAEARAARHGVRLTLAAPPTAIRLVAPDTFGLAARSLIDHAIAATARDGEVRLKLAGTPHGWTFSVEDGGPLIPPASRHDVLRRRADPTAFGRPEGFSLLVAEVTAPLLGASLSVGESASGRSELVLSAE